MKVTIFDKNGNPSLVLLKNGRLVNFDGRSIGFLYGNSVYDYNGSHRGWLESGVLRDHDGYCVGVVRGARTISTPIFPVTKVAPVIGITEIEPIKPIKAIKPVSPIKKIGWSDFSPLSLFNL
ncbi:MAG: hypothetical protein A3J63_03230 [Candidatus Moranbacteria bacterium RIFCSPHIGHO2_02_FULL_40_12b]|nr:MAG: hypothetical protein A3J63_03230 [Candidatus Moranbacteria bacterium RIFCSPHIGHO2_02_FULL_40_12b]OGI22812.1 MAG: hypothetical protein A3E91_03910 [Candidatus Moranbacteria bacterium RIFCSPHIGHO2_12_FULL_40_10]